MVKTGAGMKTIVIAGFLLTSSAAFADDKTTHALNNLQMEMTVCAVYYSQVKACVGGESEAFSVSTQQTVDFLTKQLFNVGKTIGVSQDATLSRLQMAQDEQNKLLKGDCINMASLFTRHADRCKVVVESAMSFSMST
jgi:hypothetical protein